MVNNIQVRNKRKFSSWRKFVDNVFHKSYKYEIQENIVKPLRRNKDSIKILLENDAETEKEVASATTEIVDNSQATLMKQEIQPESCEREPVLESENHYSEPELETRNDCTIPRRLKNDNEFEGTFDADVNHPALVKGLEIGSDRKFGRYVRATKEFLADEVICAAEPFASVVEGGHHHSYCLTCHKIATIFMPCNTCRAVFFCGIDCKTKNQSHQFECQTNFHRVKYSDLKIKCAIQMVFEALAIFDTVKEFRSFVNGVVEGDRGVIPSKSDDKLSKLRLILTLQMDNYEGLTNDTNKAFNIIMKFPKIVSLFNLHGRRLFLQTLLAHFLAVIMRNAFGSTLRVGKFQLKSLSIHDAFSFFNHSCLPNVTTVIGDSNVLLGVLSQNIQRGDQLFVSYMRFDSEPRSVRRRMLRKGWHFHCNCIRCVNETEIVTRLEAKSYHM